MSQVPDQLRARLRSRLGRSWQARVQGAHMLIDQAYTVEAITLGFVAAQRRFSLIKSIDYVRRMGGLEVLRDAWRSIHELHTLDIDRNVKDWLAVMPDRRRVSWAIATLGGTEP